MLFDIGLVIASHFITANLALLNQDKPGRNAKIVKIGSVVTIIVGILAIIDLLLKKILGVV